MSKDEYEKIHNEYINAVNTEGIEHYIFFGPTSTEYWKQDLKVLLINMEAYGYQNCKFINVNKDKTLFNWVFNKDNKNNTNRNTVLFSYLLKKAIREGVIVTKEQIKKEFHNGKVLEKTLEEIVIYNIKPTSNSKVKEDYKGIISSNEGRMGDYLRREILTLNPNIIVISGHSTLIAFKKLFKIHTNFKENNNIIIYNGMIIASIKHFSRPSYKKWIEVITTIEEQYSMLSQKLT